MTHRCGWLVIVAAWSAAAEPEEACTPAVLPVLDLAPFAGGDDDAQRAVAVEHAERAVVHVHTSHWCAAEQGLAPLLPSKWRGGSVLVYHPEAVASRRDVLVRYLSSTLAPPVDRVEFAARLRSLGDGQAALTEKSLAGMLRSYSVMIK